MVKFKEIVLHINKLEEMTDEHLVLGTEVSYISLLNVRNKLLDIQTRIARLCDAAVMAEINRGYMRINQLSREVDSFK